MAEAPLSPMVKDAAGNMVPRPKDMFGNPMKVAGDPGWNPMLDQNPVVQGFNALTNAMTPQYDVPATVGDVAYTPPQRDYLGDVEAANLQQNQARQNQLGIAELIAARARGEGPSIAEMQLRQSTDRLQNQQAGLIASQRGMNPALQRRLIMGQAAQGQQAMNAQGALLRAQEQQAAQALAAQTYGAMRGQDQNAYGVGAQANQGQSGINAQIATSNAQAEWNRFEAERQKAIAKANANAGMLSGIVSMGVTAAGGKGGGGGDSSPAGTGVIGYDMGKGYDEYFDPKKPLSGESLDQYDKYFDDKPDGWATGGVVPGYAQGGVPAWLSPGEAKIPPAIMGAPDAPERAARFVAAGGGMVPGTPKEPGDSAKNDTVPAILPPGTGIVPRSVMQAPDAPDRAAAFIAMLKQEAARGSAENPQAFSMGGMAQGYAMGGMAQRPMASGLSYLLRNGSK